MSYIHFLFYDLFICMCSDMCMHMYLHEEMLMRMQIPLPVQKKRSKVSIGFLVAGVTKA